MEVELAQTKIKLAHLRKRIAELAVLHEDELAQQAVVIHLLSQERESLNAELRQCRLEVEKLRSMVENGPD